MQPLPTSPTSDEFRHLLADLNIIIWKAELPRHFTFVSGATERMLGYSAELWVGDANFWNDHVHPEDRDRVTAACHDAITRGDSCKLEYRMRSADGSTVWISEIARPAREYGGETRQLLGIAVDITDRKLKEEQFQEQQSRFEQMAENIQELFWMIAVPTQHALYVNAAFETITGYKPETLLQSPLSYREIIHAEDRPWVLTRLTEAEHTGKFDEKFRIVRADGAVRWVSARGFPVRDQGGEIYRLAGVVQDITAHREAESALRDSEDRYRDLVEHSEDLLCTHDLQGKILSCNPAPARLLGYSAQEMLQISLRQLLAPEARPLFGDYLSRIERDGFAEGLMVLQTRTGERRIWQYRNTLRAEGVPAPIVRGMARDITERLSAERALRQSEERFRVAVKNSHIMVSTQNRNLQYTWMCNPMLAWADHDCIGKTDDDLLHAEDAYRAKAIKQWVLDVGTGSRTGVQISHQGRKYYLDLTVEPLFDSSGTVTGITCASTDITELHDKAERLQLLLEINSALISKLDLPQLLQVLSSCIYRLFRQDFLSMSISSASQMTIITYPLDTASLTRLTGVEVTETEEHSLAARALKSGEIELFGAAELKTGSSEFFAGSGKQPLRSLACIPIETSRGRLATLNVGSNRENAFGPEDIYLMQQLGVVVSAAMNNADIFSALHRLVDRMREEKRYLEEEFEKGDPNEVVGESSAFKDAWSRAEAVSLLGSTVILYGEAGVGKEMFARAIHRMSSRREQAFIKFNCASVPQEKQERELFGCEEETASGKFEIKVGRLELADGSTLFLEDVNELTSKSQQKLLGLLEEHRFERAGGRGAIPINVRLIVSTTSTLKEKVSEGAFRKDLYYELNGFPVHIPALRERTGDVAVLAKYFVKKYARRMKQIITHIPEQTLQVLEEWDWPGNVRELANFIERSVILTKGTELEAPLWELKWLGRESLADVLTSAEREYIFRTLQHTAGEISGPEGAAVRLGLKPAALRSKIQRLGIPKPQACPD